MGYMGNKGSVSVSMTIEGTSFCFVVAHLASGEKKGDEGRRNHQVSEIFRRTSFPRSPADDDIPHPLTILGHDRIFWFGDLNYRLYLEDNSTRQLIEKLDWRALQEFDQLRREREYGGVFQGWEEGAIEFAPTYNYSSSNCNRYSGGVPSRSGEKQRTPAWCDRILWYGKGLTQLSYFRSESKFSDHRPVSALFSTLVEVVNSTNPRVVSRHTILPTIPPPVETEQSNHDEEAESTLISLIVKDLQASPTHNTRWQYELDAIKYANSRIFWFGDLNYRLYLEDNSARQLIKKLDWRALQEFDQLHREREYGGVFQGWEEGAIEFAPTYKYSSSNCNCYSGGVPGRSGEKQRTPAWCDRILWYGKGLTQLSYFRSESKFSDHRPVSALFSTQVEVVNSTNPRVVSRHTILPTIPPPVETEQSNHDEEAESTLISLIVKDLEASPTHNTRCIEQIDESDCS